MPKRKSKRYNRPRKLYSTVRIKEENGLVNRYGLKNKREVWKTDFAVAKIRNTAKKLITASEEEKNKFIEGQKTKGFEVNSIADILGLNKEDYLKRRLQSIIVKKNLAHTHKQARQLIVHKHVTINNHVLNSPSHLTTLEEEKSVALNIALPVEKKKLTKEEEKLLEEIKEDAKKANKIAEGKTK
jgi:small subunit ribosomal protein S4